MEPEYAEGPSINEWLQCGICLDVYNEPTVLKCSHIFCKSCIEKWAERRKKCPICNADLGPNDTQPAPPVYREMLSSLRVRCNNHQDGCSTTFPGNNWKEALTEHLTVCQYATELCVCGQRIVSVQKNTHVETECELTVVCCPNNCGGKMQRRSMANHTCVEYLSSSIRAVKEESARRERRMMALPSHVSSLRTQVVDVRADVRQLKREMKTLMDEARLWMTDTTKDLEALKRVRALMCFQFFYKNFLVVSGRIRLMLLHRSLPGRFQRFILCKNDRPCLDRHDSVGLVNGRV